MCQDAEVTGDGSLVELSAWAVCSACVSEGGGGEVAGDKERIKEEREKGRERDDRRRKRKRDKQGLKRERQ